MSYASLNIVTNKVFVYKSFISIYLSIYMCVCVSVCVCINRI